MNTIFKILLLAGLSISVMAENSISDLDYLDKMTVLNLCVFQGDIASGVQLTRHEIDPTYADFRINILQLFSAYEVPHDNTLKVLEVSKDVFENIDKQVSATRAFVTYYTICLNQVNSNNLSELPRSIVH